MLRVATAKKKGTTYTVLSLLSRDHARQMVDDDATTKTSFERESRYAFGRDRYSLYNSKDFLSIGRFAVKIVYRSNPSIQR